MQNATVSDVVHVASRRSPRQEAPGSADDDVATALAGVAAGDRRALRRLYAATSSLLFGLCLGVLRDRQAAEDALQETYVTVWRRAGAFDPRKGEAMAWLSTIARNRAIDRLRASRALPQDLASALRPDQEAPADVLLERAEMEGRLRLQLDQLDPSSAWALKTAFFEGRTYAELAEEAGVPVSTMKSRIHRALLQLRRTWPRDD